MMKFLLAIAVLFAAVTLEAAQIVTGTITNLSGGVSCKVNFVKLGSTAGDGNVLNRLDIYQANTVAATGAFSINLDSGLYMMSAFDGADYHQSIISVTSTGTADYHSLAVWTATADSSTNSVATYVSTATLTNKYHGSNLVAGGTLTVANASALTNISAAKIAVGGILPVLDGGSLTNITTSSTNAVGATYATNDAAGAAILMANKLNTTNGSAVNTLMVIGANTDDPPVFTARASSAQSTNAILNVQASDQRKLFSIGSQGAVQLGTNVMANWPTAAHTQGGAAFVNSNGTVFLLISGPNSLVWTSTNKIAP